MTVSSDRWGCPHCRAVVVIHGSQEDVRSAIAACQLRHAAEHRRAAEVAGRLRMERYG